MMNYQSGGSKKKILETYKKHRKWVRNGRREFKIHMLVEFNGKLLNFRKRLCCNKFKEEDLEVICTFQLLVLLELYQFQWFYIYGKDLRKGFTKRNQELKIVQIYKSMTQMKFQRKGIIIIYSLKKLKWKRKDKWTNKGKSID